MRLIYLFESSIPNFFKHTKIMSAIKKEYPHVPDYVIYEAMMEFERNDYSKKERQDKKSAYYITKNILGLLNKGYKFSDALKEAFKAIGHEDWSNSIFEFLDKKWALRILNLSFSDLAKDTQRRLKEREFGLKNPYSVPDDERRLMHQIASGGKNVAGSNQPIIFLQKSDGYELYEGWHRTMALFWLAANPKNANARSLSELSGNPYEATIKVRAMVGKSVAKEQIDEGSIPVHKSPSQFYAGAGKALYKLFRSAFPDLPEYVANDIYNQTSPGTNDTIVNAIKQGENPKDVFLNYYSGATFNFVKDPGTDLTPNQLKNILLRGIWKQEILNVNPANFSEHSRNRMIKRNFGVNPDEDPTRIQRQQSSAKGDGSNEPVIIIRTSNGLTLWEGFHRTMSILALGRNGKDPLRWNKIKLRAWVVTLDQQP